MKLNIPEHLDHTFLEFLDVAQAMFTEEEVMGLSIEEKETLAFVEGLLEGMHVRSDRFKTLEDKKDAIVKLSQLLSP